MLVYSNERRIAVFSKGLFNISILKRAPYFSVFDNDDFKICLLKRAPHCRILENGVFLKRYFSKERRSAVLLKTG